MDQFPIVTYCQYFQYFNLFEESNDSSHSENENEEKRSELKVFFYRIRCDVLKLFNDELCRKVFRFDRPSILYITGMAKS